MCTKVSEQGIVIVCPVWSAVIPHPRVSSRKSRTDYGAIGRIHLSVSCTCFCQL